jgi:glycosyltransferase involved in cell wall biosynthesis
MNLCSLVVNHRTYDLTKTFIESYVKFYPDLPMLVIDNGSGDDSADYIRSLPRTQFQVIMNDINYGHGYALDQGMIAVNADLVMCFDSDCEVIKGGFIEPMAKAFEDRNLYAIGMFHLVNKGGIDTFIQADPEGKEYPYVHPSTGMYRRSMYLDLPPFRHHGSPCIDNMVEAHRRGYGVVEFPGIRDYVTHPWAGTRDLMEKNNWSLETGQLRPFLSFVSRVNGNAPLSDTILSLAQQNDMDYETVLITRGSYYDNRNRVFGEYVYHLDPGQMLRDPGLVTRIKCIVYNHGWPDVIRFAGGHVAIRREVWRRNCQNPAQIKADTVFECGTVVQ